MNDTTTCPSCQRPLRIPESLVGQQVKCPACGQTFQATLDEEAAPAARPAPQPERERREEAYPDEAPRRRDPDARPGRRWEDEDDRPSRRRRDDYADDRRKRRRSDYDEHRGTLILILGILAWTGFAIPCGPIAWILGNADMKEIRAGRMDPEGESSTSVGRILGMAITILLLVTIVFGTLAICLIFGFSTMFWGMG